MSNHLFYILLFISIISSFFSLIPEEVTKEDKTEEIYSYMNPKIIFDQSLAITDKKTVKFDETKKSKDIIDEMGFGWNLGNTLDSICGSDQNQGLSTETCWGASKTTEEMIDGLYSKGIRTIRIPVTWHNHIIDKNYTIDPNWMQRVKTIVDWCINKGLYVILNTHHENTEYSDLPIKYGQGYYPLKRDLKESTDFLFNIWSQISLAFNNGYDHHLIFEGLNEPRLIGTKYEWSHINGEPLCEEATSVINEFTRICVKAIRESGGNNEKRFFMLTGGSDSDLIFPDDKKYNPYNCKFLFSTHIYAPHNLAMNADMKYTTFEEEYANSILATFKMLYEKFILKGHYVVIGEMGTINKNNTLARIEAGTFFVENARKYQMASVLWDNEKFNNKKTPSEVFGMFHRKELTWENEDLMDAYIKSSFTELLENIKEEFKSSLITKPIEFNSWSVNYQISKNEFRSFHSYTKFCFTTEDLSFNPSYKSLIINQGDWGGKFNITKDEIEGADYYQLTSINIRWGTSNVKIKFNEKNIKFAKEKGIILNGYGFKISKLSICGPKLATIEPMNLIRSNVNQTIKLYFSENAEVLEDKIKFINEYNNLNEKVSCKLSKDDKAVIECKGIFDFTGEYKISDDNGILLSIRSFNIIPKEGEKYNIDNLLENKVNLDDANLLKKIFFNSNFLNNLDLNINSILVIKTEELSYISCNNRIMYIYKGNNSNLYIFNKNDVNTNVLEEGGIIVNNGNNFIKINLKNVYKEFLKNGFSIKGYGFSIKAIYLEQSQKVVANMKQNYLDKRFIILNKLMMLGFLLLLI